jgi:predicted acyltransferase
MDLTEAPAAKPRKRLVSLDVFRGLTVLLMLLVNNSAMDSATPKQFLHAPWNQGMHLADIVFPWFLFAVGIAIPFSVRGALKRGTKPGQIYARAAGRTIALLVVGCIVDSAIEHRLYLGLGVLQLIGLAYLLGSIMYSLPARRRAVAAGLLLLTYGLAIMFIPVPGIGKPVFEEGRNLIHFVNMEYLLDFRLKGLLSAVPTGALVAIGTVIGDMALASKTPDKGFRGFVQSFVGYLLCSGILIFALGMIWSCWLPLNKPVWTPSYILVSAGLGSICIAALSLLFDAGRLRWLALPLQVFGANALLAYVAPILIKVIVLQTIEVERNGATLKLQEWLLKSLTDPFGEASGGWAYTITYILVVWVGLGVLYRKRWFLRV